MIDNLISDPIKNIWINLDYILKDTKFLIFRDFFGIFLKFSEFNLIYFELNSYIYYRVLTWHVT